MADDEMSPLTTLDLSVSQSKRTLLKAGWVAPVVVVLSLPAVSFDANASGKACVPGRGPSAGSPANPPVTFCPR